MNNCSCVLILYLGVVDSIFEMPIQCSVFKWCPHVLVIGTWPDSMIQGYL